MEYWEFLIQKEGDRSWLPLETPEVEIIEARYRVVARSSHVNETVEIQITYQSTDEEPPKRRVQKRESKTNAEGLLAVIPFTYLKPGVWKLECRGSSTSESPGWQYAVSLQVLSNQSEIGEESTYKPMEKSAAPLPESEVVKERSPQESKPVPPQKLLQLTLNRDTYIRRRGKPITISGRVEVAGATSIPVPVKAAKLHIQLRVAETSQVLVKLEQPLPQIVPPIPFSCGLEIPADCENNLILGEITLSEGTSEAVDRKSFTIAPDVEDLLDAIDENLIKDLTSERQETPDKIFYDLLETLQNPQRVEFKPSTERPLPPQLYKPTAEQAGSKPLDLPSFPRFKPDASIVKPKQPSSVEPTPPIEESKSQSDIAEIENEAATTVASETAEPIQIPTPEQVSQPEDKSILSQKLRERFLSRLNALANDAELTEWLKSELLLSPPVTEAAPENVSEKKAEVTVKTVADWEAQEVVVFEEVEELQQESASKSGCTAITGYESELLILPEDEPVPTPVLYVRQEQLVAGRTVTVFVRLPDTGYRICVKVWLQDLQSRSLLDGPHWVTEFSYNAWGDLEATVPVMVPLGSFQVQFEAIAIETLTKRESHKVFLSRQVIPPPPPSLPLQ
ncbi:MAG: hypothetical protein N3E45_05790 [Oscillatoriaceae bacterium SKW80]|nr:hypothetical protein [Oscillatoriaceae bacterium SKYG93]MCX8120325.1 hypothetical protein [Oscillatoriaceae bacterium SKW80]MDW8453251.1 hypothetical protein [Oscillatoriaceae cyanobacterium SKYGB_i_bin93]HIK27306.1 hypothetical protein [Oscillatoriaceae cyanobacterium M7585_C2015_266]